MAISNKHELFEYIKNVIIESKVSTVEHDLNDNYFHKNKDILHDIIKNSIRNSAIPAGLPKALSFDESVSMRSKLINWLRQVNKYRHSKPGVLALTVAIIDRYCYHMTHKKSSFSISSENYQYVGAAAYHLASKLEEVSPIVTKDLARFTEYSCTEDDIQDLELIISIELKFDTRFSTAVDMIYVLTSFLDEYVEFRHQLVDLNRTACDNFLSMINHYRITKFPIHVIGATAVIVSYFEMDFFNPKLYESLNQFVCNLCSIKKQTIMQSYEAFTDLLACSEKSDQSSSSKSGAEDN